MMYRAATCSLHWSIWCGVMLQWHGLGWDFWQTRLPWGCVVLAVCSTVLVECLLQLRATRPAAAVAAPPCDRPEEDGIARAVAVAGTRLQRGLYRCGLAAEVEAAEAGPLVMIFLLARSPGCKVRHIRDAAEELAGAVKAASLRVGFRAEDDRVTVEIPAPRPRPVVWEAQLEGLPVDAPLAVPLGVDTAGRPVQADLAGLPHLLVAGETGAGKSVAIHAMLAAMLRLEEDGDGTARMLHAPEALRLLLIDLKGLDFPPYGGIPHLLGPVITEPRAAVQALRGMVAEMDGRAEAISRARARHIQGYNARMRQMRRPNECLPYAVIVIDELADLMTKEWKRAALPPLAQLARKGRAFGLHVILGTQRPSTDVIEGDIKVNVPGRLVLKVPTKTDSRVALDAAGAEVLLPRGDALWQTGHGPPRRVHTPLITEAELDALLDRLRAFPAPDTTPAWIAPGDADSGFAGGYAEARASAGAEKNTYSFNRMADGARQPEAGWKSAPAQASPAAAIEHDPLLREAATFTVKEQRCSGRLLLQHLKARGFSIGKDTIYATVLPALEAAGVVGSPGTELEFAL